MIKNFKILIILLLLIYSFNLRAQNVINWVSWDQMIELRNKDSIKKKVFIDFYTNWCGWCKKLDNQILSKESFVSFAKENLVLLELDFPRGSRNLPQDQIDLARKFNISGYPTVILMDAETNQIGKTGYQYMNPENYVSHVKSLLKQ